jgi:hypothetical protein
MRRAPAASAATAPVSASPFLLLIKRAFQAALRDLRKGREAVVQAHAAPASAWGGGTEHLPFSSSLGGCLGASTALHRTLRANGHARVDPSSWRAPEGRAESLDIQVGDRRARLWRVAVGLVYDSEPEESLLTSGFRCGVQTGFDPRRSRFCHPASSLASGSGSPPGSRGESPRAAARRRSGLPARPKANALGNLPDGAVSHFGADGTTPAPVARYSARACRGVAGFVNLRWDSCLGRGVRWPGSGRVWNRPGDHADPDLRLRTHGSCPSPARLHARLYVRVCRSRLADSVARRRVRTLSLDRPGARGLAPHCGRTRRCRLARDPSLSREPGVTLGQDEKPERGEGWVNQSSASSAQCSSPVPRPMPSPYRAVRPLRTATQRSR